MFHLKLSKNHLHILTHLEKLFPVDEPKGDLKCEVECLLSLYTLCIKSTFKIHQNSIFLFYFNLGCPSVALVWIVTLGPEKALEAQIVTLRAAEKDAGGGVLKSAQDFFENTVYSIGLWCKTDAGSLKKTSSVNTA